MVVLEGELQLGNENDKLIKVHGKFEKKGREKGENCIKTGENKL